MIIDNPLGKSDHSLIKFQFNAYTENIPRKSRLLCNKADYGKMSELLDINWKDCLVDLTVQEQWEIIAGKLSHCVKECTPEIIINPNSKGNATKNVDKKLNTKVKRKKRLWRKYKTENKEEDRLEYNRVRNQVRNLTRKKVKQKEKSIAENAKSNPKGFWNYVQRKSKTKSSIPNLYTGEVNDKDNLSKDDKEKAEVLSSFFSSVFTKEDDNNVPNIGVKENVDCLDQCKITISDVRRKLQKLNISKSPGPDGIHPRVLKEMSEVLAQPLQILFQNSFNTGTLPEEWKNANITALYKKGDKKYAGNYRPVSLTCILCKVLESLIREKIVGHMNKYKLFSKKQFGFISGRSTVLQLLHVLDRWTEMLDEGSCVDIAYCDFMKAFDKVPHKRLLHKLKMYNIGGKYRQWLESFLIGRKQTVKINGESSDSRPVTSGIPQGSVMGPVLFVLYINDLPDSLKHNSEVYLYADDTKIFRDIKDDSDSLKLQEDIYEMHAWSEKWLLRFHPDKTKRMRIGKSKTVECEYKLREHLKPMEKSTAEKDVGVIIDDQLNFEKHMTEKINKANRVLGAIRRTFQYLDNKTFRLLYTSLVRPIVEYANPIWCPYKLKYIDMLEKLQRRATKLLPGMDNLNYPERLEILKLPSLAYRRHRGDLIETFKIVNEKYDPEVCEGFFKYRESGTRGHSKKIFKERARLEVRRNSFKIRVVDIWNSLPQKLVNCNSVPSFERNLDKFWKKQDNQFHYRENISTKLAHSYVFNTIEEDQELATQVNADLLSEEEL